MHIRPYLDLRYAILAAALVAASVPVSRQEQVWRRILKASEAEQTSWIKAHLDRGMQGTEADSSVFIMLVLNRSELTLPLIEQKIEEVLQSSTPAGCFSDKSVDPNAFIARAKSQLMQVSHIQLSRMRTITGLATPFS